MKIIDADAFEKYAWGNPDIEVDGEPYISPSTVQNFAADHPITIDPPNAPLTQADLDEMHFDRVWIDYGLDDEGERCGEEGVMLYGKLYSIDTLDGAGLEDLILDATGQKGETLDNPSGNYTVYRRPPEGEEDIK